MNRKNVIGRGSAIMLGTVGDARGRAQHAVALGIALACMLAWASYAFALDPALDVSQYAHTAWRIREGFAKGTVNAIAQTPDDPTTRVREFLTGLRPPP